VLLSLLFVLFCSANQYGRMQFNTGVRHVVPVTPFVFLLAAIVFVRLPTVFAAVVGVTATYWSWCLCMYRDVERGSGVLQSIKHITRHGPELPWLTTLQRMDSPFSTQLAHGAVTYAILASAAVLVAAIWYKGPSGSEARARRSA
jgi:hypothetical protein